MDDPQTRLEPRNTIGVVCRRTGLKSDRLRAWERRFGVVRPVRSQGNQRLYSEEDVDRLLLLRQATDAGYRIAQIAHLSAAALGELLDMPSAGAPRRWLPSSPEEAAEAGAVVAACLAAVQQLDAEALEGQLQAAFESLRPAAITQQVLVPLIHDVGDLWAEGGLDPAHEHFGTAVIRRFIERLRESLATPPAAPRLLVTTPAGERHELGALLAAAAATDAGWSVTYIGPDLPATDVASAARQSAAQAIGLSVVSPADAGAVRTELATLRRHVGPTVGIIIGGRAAATFTDTATEIGAVVVEDLIGLGPALALFA